MKIHNPRLLTQHNPGTSEELLPELLVDSTVSSAVSTIDLIIPSSKRDFTSYYLWLAGLKLNAAPTDGIMSLLVSFDGGTTFETGSADYEYVGVRYANATAIQFQDAGDPGWNLTQGQWDSASGGRALSGFVLSHNMGDANNFPQIRWCNNFNTASGTKHQILGVGHYDGGTRGGVGFGRVTAFRFAFGASGSLLRGSFRLYGIR